MGLHPGYGRGRSPQLVKTLEAARLAKGAGYSRPHTVPCGPEGNYMSCLGGADGAEGPGSLLDHGSFDVLRRWEVDRGRQFLAYDVRSGLRS